jgi:hypothetical protein
MTTNSMFEANNITIKNIKIDLGKRNLGQTTYSITDDLLILHRNGKSIYTYDISAATSIMCNGIKAKHGQAFAVQALLVMANLEDPEGLNKALRKPSGPRVRYFKVTAPEEAHAPTPVHLHDTMTTMQIGESETVEGYVITRLDPAKDVIS